MTENLEKPEKPKKQKAAKKTKAPAKPLKLKGALVIVESPAKCKTIEKILGKDFEVKASMGHIIDLPKSRMGVDIEHNFKPQYIVMVKKRKILTQLKKSVEKKADLYLACDPDREGEAISWHLGNELGKNKNVYRVRFQEITKDAISKAFQHPVKMDMDKVAAQQARRILDRIVGYSLSPLLWVTVAKGLSAGRVQSVALRMIVDQELLIKAFVPVEYWSLDAKLKKHGQTTTFDAIFETQSGEKVEVKTGAEAAKIAAEIKKENFVVSAVKSTQKRRQPQAPYTTSKLQQEAYNRLKLRPARTMAIAQSLYEGVDIGGETIGLITYMRTDSVVISDSAMVQLREYIPKQYGPEYLPDQPNAYKTKKSAQEAHEAIRPTSILRTPESLVSVLDNDQYRLYELIWRKFTASQMTPAVFRQNSADIAAGIYGFKATGSQMEFPGFLKVFGDEVSEGKFLPELEVGEKLSLVELGENQHFTKPPARYTDASLVKALEEEGIGRPSTYAPIIQTLMGRNYIERQGGALIPTELGFLVVDLLVKNFPELMDVGFTAGMEDTLDKIEEGDTKWQEVLKEFYARFSKNLDAAKTTIAPVRRAEQPTGEICEKCSRPMVIKWGRRGKFMSCSGFPECKNAKSIPTGVACTVCGKGMMVARRAKSGKGRPFFGCSQYPECTHVLNKLPSAGGAQENKPDAVGSRDDESGDAR